MACVHSGGIKMDLAGQVALTQRTQFVDSILTREGEYAATITLKVVVLMAIVNPAAASRRPVAPTVPLESTAAQ